MEAMDMKSLSILGSAIWVMAFAGNLQAESMGYQCRAAVRAEMKGPDCRIAIPPNPTSHCNIPTNAEVDIWTIKFLNARQAGWSGTTIKNRIMMEV
jgi:hypothetical protein